MGKQIFIPLFVLLLITAAAAESPEPLFEMSTEIGCGFYTGSFLDHLKTDGAFTATPTIDTCFATYITPWLGMQLQIGGGAVIHPASEPMEGVILYLSVGPFVKWDMGPVFLKGWVDGGFQQPTMSLQWYGSGFIETGLQGGFDFSDSRSVVLSIRYRTQILQSIIISEKYASIDSNDNLSSLTLSAGWAVRL